MMRYPEVMAEARREIDKVVGRDRLPTFSDRKALPFREYISSHSVINT
jgi:hypothetical protein